MYIYVYHICFHRPSMSAPVLKWLEGCRSWRALQLRSASTLSSNYLLYYTICLSRCSFYLFPLPHYWCAIFFVFQRHLAPPENRPSMSDLADMRFFRYAFYFFSGILLCRITGLLWATSLICDFFFSATDMRFFFFSGILLRRITGLLWATSLICDFSDMHFIFSAASCSAG